MEPTTADPSIVAPVTTPAADTPAWPVWMTRASTALAWLAVASFVGGVVLFALPVANRYRGRTLQDCGVPAAYLWDGRSSATVSTSDPPTFIRPADRNHIDAINAHQCSSLVAERAVPGSALLLGVVVLGLVAFVLAIIGHRADERAAMLAPPPPPPAQG
ncbi:MAG TPA: hypothetical protein VHA73_13570 [Acidimicrobiales bacterium]|jgi:hypothetical protein|nr:hypothetical protein [Acidimicrobiales bacterium]